MGATIHIKTALTAKDKKIKDLAAAIEKPEQSLYNQLTRDTWKFAEVEKIAGVLGCEVVLRDKETGQIF